MKTLHTPVKPSEFLLPQEEREVASVEGQRGFAKGVLLNRLLRIVWTACMDEGPSVSKTVECVRVLTTASWPEAPHTAVASLQAMVAQGWDARVEAIRAQGALPAEEVDKLAARRGVWARYGEALELFAKYEIALQRIATGTRQPWDTAELTESEVG